MLQGADSMPGCRPDSGGPLTHCGGPSFSDPDRGGVLRGGGAHPPRRGDGQTLGLGHLGRSRKIYFCIVSSHTPADLAPSGQSSAGRAGGDAESCGVALLCQQRPGSASAALRPDSGSLQRGEGGSTLFRPPAPLRVGSGVHWSQLLGSPPLLPPRRRAPAGGIFTSGWSARGW